MDPIISLQDVKKSYRMGQTTVRALRGVTLTLARGQIHSIVGPSGSGKSSLLHIIGCMDLPTGGEVYVSGRRVSKLPEKALTAIRAQEIGFVFQAFHLNPILNARENVAMALRFLGVGRRDALRRADGWLARVGLAHRTRHYPAELSGGERQRVAIARAIAKRPALILADEPTGNLDTQCGQEIVKLLRAINQETHTTIIQVTHDKEVARTGDAILTLRDGRIVDH